jgi:mannopine transport system permease protein
VTRALFRPPPRSPMYGPLLTAALLAPFLVLLGFGFIYPLSDAIRTSLHGSHTGAAYGSLVHDHTFWLIFRRTFETALLVAVICVAVAYPTAEFVKMAPARIRPLLLALIIVPLWSSTIARTYSWVGIFIRNGLADRVAVRFGHGPLMLLYTQFAVTVGMVHVLLPFVLLPVYAAVRNYDERLSHASRSLGAGTMRTLLRVKLPVLAPALVAAGTAVFVLALGFFITPAVLGGPTSLLISNLISQQVFQAFDLARGDAMGVLLVGAVLASLAVMGVFLFLLNRRARTA